MSTVVTCHVSPGPVISVTRVTSGVSTEQAGAVSGVSVSARVRFYHHWMARAGNGQPGQNLGNTRQISGHKTQACLACLALGTEGCMF